MTRRPLRLVPAVAWAPLAAVALALAVLLAVFSSRYGYHRDELYYLAAGHHLAWGYDDVPPLLPAWSRLAGGSLVLLRLPSELVAAAGVLLVGLLARELGGDRAAQVLAAAGWASAGVVVISGHLLSTTPYDIACWTALAYLLARWARVGSDRLLLVAGAVLGVGLLVKNLPLLYAAGLAGGVLIAGPRELLRRPATWLAGVIALAIWAPNLWWQARHGWPQLDMTGVIRADADFGGRAGLLPSQLLIFGPVLAPVWIAGLWRLLRGEQRFRFLGWAYLIVLALVLLTGGREYYPAGATSALFAAGAVATVRWMRERRPRRLLAGGAVAVNAVSSVALGLPVYPAGMLAGTPEAAIDYDAGETVGWQELVRTVAAVYRTLPPGAVILADNYGEAGAIDRYGPGLGLPPAYSGHLAYWRWGPPPATATGPVIVIGRYTREDLSQYCGSAQLVAHGDNGYGLDNDEQGVPVWVCRDLTRPWAEIWPGLRHL